MLKVSACSTTLHTCLQQASKVGRALQVVLDLGRRPEARFLGGRGGEFLREEEVTQAPDAVVGASHATACRCRCGLGTLQHAAAHYKPDLQETTTPAQGQRQIT